MACQEAAAVVAKARKCRSREHAAIQARTPGEVKRGGRAKAAVLLVELRGDAPKLVKSAT